MRTSEYFVHGCDPTALIVRQIMEDAVVTVSPTSSNGGGRTAQRTQLWKCPGRREGSDPARAGDGI